MTPPKKWPEEAEWARQDAISTIDHAVGELDELLDEDLPPHLLRKVGKLIKRLKTAQIELITCRSTQLVRE